VDVVDVNRQPLEFSYSDHRCTSLERLHF
jgi:hypothetical protein